MKFFLCVICLNMFVFSLKAEDNYSSYFEKTEIATKYLKDEIQTKPKLLMVLTAGVKGPLDEMEDKVEIEAKNIPYFPVAKAKGHDGKLIFGKYKGHDIVVMKGRYHYYEGNTAQEVVFPYFVLNNLGVESVITVNAVGGININYKLGDIMLVKDHINYLADNCLRGLAIQFPEKQFTDMTEAYSKEYQDIARNVAAKLNIDIKEGLYLATTGPNYETLAEVKMFRTFGADAVGMSTVFEVLACNFLEMKVLAFSCITDTAIDYSNEIITHEKVLEELQNAEPKLSKIMNLCAEEILK